MSALGWQNYNYCLSRDLTESVTRVVRLRRSSFSLTEFWIYQGRFSGYRCQTVASVQVLSFFFCSCYWNQKDEIKDGCLRLFFSALFVGHFKASFPTVTRDSVAIATTDPQIISTPWWREAGAGPTSMQRLCCGCGLSPNAMLVGCVSGRRVTELLIMCYYYSVPTQTLHSALGSQKQSGAFWEKNVELLDFFRVHNQPD